MEYKRVPAMAIAVLFVLTSCAYVISAHEDEGVPLIITAPAEGAETMSCAVFFADNMVYTPQWRLDNYVRIEVMVLSMDSYADPSELVVADTNLYPSELIPDPLAQQAAIIADSATYLPMTKMVSVSYIEVTVTSDVLDEPVVFAAGWDHVTGEKVIEVNGFGREVNKAGHLIYGTLWDTTGLEAGAYTTEVKLGVAMQDELGLWYGAVGEWYDVNYAIGHLYNPEVEGEYLVPDHPYGSLGVEGTEAFDVYKLGEGGLTADDVAWIELGPLIPQGAGGGSGNGGDGGGNGNGGDGDGGNGYGGENGGGGNGHGGKLNQAHSYVK